MSSMTTVTGQWASACAQSGCECGTPTVSYTAWNGTSFKVIGFMSANSVGDCTGGSATATYTVTRQ